MAINQIYFRVLHLALVILDGSFVLEDSLFLVVDLLFGDGVLRKCGLIPAQVDLSFIQQGLIVSQLSFDLSQLSLIGPRIDIQQRIALMNQLAFTIVDVNDLSLHAAGDGVGVDGSDGAEGVDIYADVSFAHSRCGNGHSTRSGIGLGGGGSLLRLMQIIIGARGQKNDDCQGPNPLVTCSSRL